MIVNKRALSFNEAKQNGFEIALYSFKDLPLEFNAILKAKIWGKSQNLLLFFEDIENCKLYGVSIFRTRSNNAYTPRKMPDLDLSSNQFQPGHKFVLRTRGTKRGNTDLLEAIKI